MKNSLSFLKNIDFAGFLDGASKTLNVVNQAIPVYNQVKPMISNLKMIKNIQESLKEETPQETTKNQTSSIFYI